MKALDITFAPIGENKAFLNIANQIRNHIEKGVLKVDSRLPSERELAEKFQTSRATVREALRALEIIGIIESKVGQGTFIKNVNFSSMDGSFVEISKQTSPSEVFEARFAFEPYLANLAALRATHQDFVSLKAILDEFDTAIANRDIPHFEKLDGQFHHVIALSAKNSFLLHVVNIINNVRLEKLWGTLKERSLNMERMKQYQVEHQNIYQAIYERDADQASLFTLNHLKNVRENMLGQ
ncbi:FadR/GntR family transcriptional regulator [Aneurinibacillus sp. Ricciae_BoGa-3]|uniref:FadR/GntR family transcriptional regulator n=1 Tax=Aneurinibacillus sp. Ricciae_BoGa-3 TaxID=3022697 RepID=UPI0023407B5E|nr:FadR/GntR family transcriptional regulator [Aneurinibacillus sp. Ricciae_BoGa-3]WCK53734.1 FadR/GntR family transcriptional regulator [Aneurinibacillus sp. Ricciae_BoGa-3]